MVENLWNFLDLVFLTIGYPVAEEQLCQSTRYYVVKYYMHICKPESRCTTVSGKFGQSTVLIMKMSLLFPLSHLLYLVSSEQSKRSPI